MAKLTIDLTAEDINEIVTEHLRTKYNISSMDGRYIELNWTTDQTGCVVTVMKAAEVSVRDNPFRMIVEEVDRPD